VLWCLNRNTDLHTQYGDRLPDGCLRLKLENSRETYASILRSARKLYSFETSAVLGDALLCGCEVFIMSADGVWQPYVIPESLDKFYKNWELEKQRVAELLADARTFFGL